MGSIADMNINMSINNTRSVLSTAESRRPVKPYSTVFILASETLNTVAPPQYDTHFPIGPRLLSRLIR
jgi:hypothetical protein